MLEQSVLFVQPWQAVAGKERSAHIRQVLDAAGVPLGFVREAALRSPRWLRWLARRTLAVHELPDASLVFALQRSWGWPSCWQVLDADDRLVGTLRGQALQDG